MDITVTAFQRIAVIHWSRARKADWLARELAITPDHALITGLTDEQLVDSILAVMDARQARRDRVS